MAAFEDSYAGKLRKVWGKDTLIVPGASAIIYDDQGAILLTRRRDDGTWVMPAGSIELGESIVDCLVREVREETGLDVLEYTPVVIYTDPKFSLKNAFGERHQLFTVMFRVDKWSGTLEKKTEETIDAGFFRLESFPSVTEFTHQKLKDLSAFNGQIILR